MKTGREWLSILKAKLKARRDSQLHHLVEDLHLIGVGGAIACLFDKADPILLAWALLFFVLAREALQKYPEQSFAQKFSLCNRQKFSGRKIKEGF